MALEQQLKSKPNFPQSLHDLQEPCGATVHMACVVQGSGNKNPHKNLQGFIRVRVKKATCESKNTFKQVSF